jgi:hypothetical protein
LFFIKKGKKSNVFFKFKKDFNKQNTEILLFALLSMLQLTSNCKIKYFFERERKFIEGTRIAVSEKKPDLMGQSHVAAPQKKNESL